MPTINMVIGEADGVVVIRGLEFPGVIVEGSTFEEAKAEFAKSLDQLLKVRAELAIDQYPLAKNERVEKARMELQYNE